MSSCMVARAAGPQQVRKHRRACPAAAAAAAAVGAGAAVGRNTPHARLHAASLPRPVPERDRRSGTARRRPSMHSSIAAPAVGDVVIAADLEEEDSEPAADLLRHGPLEQRGAGPAVASSEGDLRHL